MSPSAPITQTSRPKAIVFDLLTALLDSWSLWNSSVPPQPNFDLAAAGRRWREHYLTLTFGQGAYAPYEDLVRRAAAESDLPVSAPISLVHNWSSLLPWPEVPSILVRLHELGYKVGVITNCSAQLGEQAVRNLETFVRAETGKDFRVDATVTAEESGFYKPVRQAYDAILPRLGDGVTREDVLFVAGSAFDVQGATDSGYRVVWNNHIGLKRKGTAVPEKEGRELGEALEAYLK